MRDTITLPSTDADDWVHSPVARSIRAQLGDSVRPIMTRTPGRLDVMGGFSDYAGASVVYMPTGACVHVGAAPRRDDRIVVTDVTSSAASSREPAVVDGEMLVNGSAQGCVSGARKLVFGDDPTGIVHTVLGTIIEGRREGVVPPRRNGLSVVVHTNGPALSCCGRSAAVSAGVLAALAGARLDVRTAGSIIRQVEQRWLAVPVGGGDGACAWSGRAAVLSTYHGHTASCGGGVALPPGLQLVGLYCGVQRPDAAEKFLRAREAAYIGAALIRRIVEAEPHRRNGWDGFLATLGVKRFVEQFRDRIPTKLRGREFIERFGESNADGIQIDPNIIYKVRSRTEHHVYEQERTAEFMSLAVRASTAPSPDLFAEMGEAMYGSHWSYGQRCGLGSVESDFLVRSIRQRGVSSGLYGARVSGRGCGGVITVLLESSERATAALDEIIESYAARTGHAITRLENSIPGVSLDGVREVP